MTWEVVLCSVMYVLAVSVLLAVMLLEYRETGSLKKTLETYVFCFFAVVCASFAIVTRLTLWGVLSLVCIFIDIIKDKYLEHKKKKKEEPTLL